MDNKDFQPQQNKNASIGKVKRSEHIYAVKVRTEGNGLGVIKTIGVAFLIALQAVIMVAAYTFFVQAFKWYLVLAIIFTVLTCLYVLSSDIHGQAKAMWIFFLIVCFSFSYVIYWLSDKHVLFMRAKKKYKQISDQNKYLQLQPDLKQIENKEVKSICDYLYKTGNFATHFDSKTHYFSSGAQLYDDVLEQLEKAKEFIFIEFYIISNGVLLNRVLDILKKKAKNGVDVRIIYDDMGSHGTIKRRTKDQIIESGIKLKSYNRLLPIFNLALNLRDHRKIIIIDGKVSYTGGTNLADEYVNEKRMHGYWKDCGIKIEGKATDNLTIAFLSQWQYINKQESLDCTPFLNKVEKQEGEGVVVPFVSGPNNPFSIAQNMYSNQIANAKEKLYIMTPYFIPDETIKNQLLNKARSGVDVRIILPEVADKKMVYFVSRNNAEKLMKAGVKIYTMTSSFVHSKVMLSENSAIIGSINTDLRSFYQQFESAVFTSEKQTINEVEKDFIKTINHSKEITEQTKKRNKLYYRLLVGLLNLISPFM